MSQVLDTAIYGEHHIMAILWHFYRLQVFYDMTGTILNYATATFFSGKRFIHGQFKTFLTNVINPGETHQMRGHFAARVIALVFTLKVNAGNTQFHNLGS